jgi:hypothetical protein
MVIKAAIVDFWQESPKSCGNITSKLPLSSSISQNPSKTAALQVLSLVVVLFINGHKT